MLRLGKQQLYLFFKLNVVKFQIPSSLSNMGSEQLGLCPLPELALHLHPNYAQPKVSPRTVLISSPGGKVSRTPPPSHPCPQTNTGK